MFKQLARSALKPVSAGVDYVKRRPAGVTVLIYHRVGAGSGSEVDLDTSVFADQMAELAESGRVIALDDALAAVSTTGEEDPGPVVVTFDDGTPDVVENALPILQEHRIPITLYLATGWVDSDRGFWDPADPVLSWAALSDAVSTGLVDIGSHTHNHALLDRIEAAEAADELDKSIDAIGTHLGAAPRHFAYPKALPPSDSADALVRERFESAAIAGTQPNPYGHTDPYLLARSPIQRSDGMVWFRRKAAGGMGFEDRLRDLINKRRYAGVSS